MLAPETRYTLTDALRPPAGYAVEIAVATTFSLDLMAILLAPMTFALHEESVRDLDRVDPIKLLEATQRHASHTTVFTQAGHIHVPGSYRRILSATEQCVHAVSAPNPGRVFHPKIWAVRYESPGGQRRHRFLCSSRNLTFDRSWDTVLVLDELSPDDDLPSAEAAPLSHFLAELPNLCIRELPAGRRVEVESIASSIAPMRFGLPEGFTSGRLLPLGLRWSDRFPVLQADRALVISPFLDVTTARGLSNLGEVRLLSRSESFDRVGKDAVGKSETFVLHRAAEREVGADLDDPTPARPEGDVTEGLHAKTWILESGDLATVITGSANATSAGMGPAGNVEFDVVLAGPRATSGIDALWVGSPEAPGLARLAQPYTPAADHSSIPASDETERAIEWFHTRLAGACPRGIVHELDDGRYELEWSVDLPELVGESTIRPATLGDTWAQPLASEVRWRPLSLSALTPYLAVSTTAGHGRTRCTVATVLVVELVGDPEQRRHDAMADVLRTPHDVLRYLALLLGDAALSGWSGTGGEGWDRTGGPLGNRDDIVLFEPLARALATGRGLDRVAAGYQQLSELDGARDLIPPGWDELWAAAWTAHTSRKST